MTRATITRRTEPAHRTSDGLDACLCTADPGALLDSLAASRDTGTNSQETTINTWRNDHARTDR
jgi:hypothetical protein